MTDEQLSTDGGVSSLGEELAIVLGGKIDGLTRLSGGASRETWAFDRHDSGVTDRLVVQRFRPGRDAMVTREVALLRAAAAIGVPVAAVVASGGPDSPLGRAFFVTRRVDGETIPRKLLRDPEHAAVRPKLAGECGRALAGIHRIPLDAAPDLTYVDPIEQIATMLDTAGDPRPVFEIGLRQLAATRPVSSATTVVHGDFRNGNLIVDERGIAAVLDWELAHLGDPMEDLGWLCVRAWRFGAEPPVGGFGGDDELFAAYAVHGGGPVDPAAVRWWEVLGTLRWGVICMTQAHAHLDGWARSVELATIGRRACENEYDLLDLLWPEGRVEVHAEPGPAAGAPTLYGRPTAAELVDAVREFLEGDVTAAADGRLRFHTRVAVNALRMVERELAAGAGAVERHQERVAALGFDSDSALAAAVRSGALDDRLDALAAALWPSVLDELAVANPRYAT